MRIIIVLGCSCVLALTSLVGCAEKSDNTAPASTAAPTPAPQAPTAAPIPTATASAAPAQKVEIAIASVGDTMAFSKTKLSVPTGAEVHVTFKNSGTQEVMQHNWVLVKPGKEAAVAAEGLAKAPDAGYVVPTNPDILAFTPLTKPGGTAETTFTAPAPGAYPYICTFPGHYIMMKGVLTVTP